MPIPPVSRVCFGPQANILISPALLSFYFFYGSDRDLPPQIAVSTANEITEPLWQTREPSKPEVEC